MRTFIALPLPLEMVSAINTQLQPLREIHQEFRWTREENLHITLAFLGELDDPGIAIVNEAVNHAVQKKHPISIGTGTIFTLPQGRPANVLALGIEQGKQAIARLAADVEKRLTELGKQKNYSFRTPERRIFVPHITLARRGSVPLKLSPAERNISIQAQGIIDTLRVFKSDLGRNGPVYTPLSGYPLLSNLS
jgi:2'-5' RNA ligase